MSHPGGIMVVMGQEREAGRAPRALQPTLMPLPEPARSGDDSRGHQGAGRPERAARLQEAGLVGIARARTALAEAVQRAEARAEEERRAGRAA
jgi:hypothetical protein